MHPSRYVLLACVSRIYARHGEHPLGKLHLNVSGCTPAPTHPSLSSVHLRSPRSPPLTSTHLHSPPLTSTHRRSPPLTSAHLRSPPFVLDQVSGCPPAPTDDAHGSPVGAALHAALVEVLPLCARQAMSIRCLNDKSLVPAKDHEANCIWPAALQLPAASLLLDEAMLAPGKLSPKGVANIQALKDVLEAQKVAYDFQYFTVDFPLDVTLLSISTSKSMLPFETKLPLRVDPAAANRPAEWSTPGWLLAARAYLGLASRMQARLGAMEPALSKRAQEDFVAARQQDASVSADDFARLLTCTRLVAASMLAATEDSEHYEHAKALEAMRTARLRSRDVEL